MISNAALAGILWIAAIAVLIAYVLRRRKRATMRQKMMDNLKD